MRITKLAYRLPQHILGSVKYHYGLNYILAGVFTYIIVVSGFDWGWYNFALNHLWIYRAGFASVSIGFFVPILLPTSIYLIGTALRNVKLQIIGLGSGQAAILGSVISSFIKVFTGRIPPQLFTHMTQMGGFQFGFLKGGAFWGWPSSHTTAAFAMAVALIELYPDSKVIKVCALLFAFIIGLGVSVNIHWLADAVAGALIGYAIGKSVGKGFSKLQVNGKI